MVSVEFDLSEQSREGRIHELRKELSPRARCKQYVMEKGGRATLILREEMDELLKSGKFSEGPFQDNFGGGYGEPYYPHRQVYGTLKEGDKIVFCELHEGKREKHRELLELLENRVSQ